MITDQIGLHSVLLPLLITIKDHNISEPDLGCSKVWTRCPVSKLLSMGLDKYFSNLLITHEETKEITTLKEVQICDPNYHKIQWTFASIFSKNYHCFSYSGAVLWNNLPTDLRQAESFSDFSRLCSTHFILLGNFCIFRHGIHVKQFLWFYFFGFGLDVGLDIVS